MDFRIVGTRLRRHPATISKYKSLSTLFYVKTSPNLLLYFEVAKSLESAYDPEFAIKICVYRSTSRFLTWRLGALAVNPRAQHDGLPETSNKPIIFNNLTFILMPIQSTILDYVTLRSYYYHRTFEIPEEDPINE